MHRRNARAGLLALALVSLVPAVAAGVAEAAAAAPERAAIREAGRWLGARRGVNSFAVIDSRGRLHGHATRRRYAAASTVKAMLLVAYLRRARLRGFSVQGNWPRARFGAADGARFMMRFERLTPRRTRRLARKLLATVTRSQRWGASSAASRAGWTPYFKGRLAPHASRAAGARAGAVSPRPPAVRACGDDRRQPLSPVRHRDPARGRSKAVQVKNSLARSATRSGTSSAMK